MQNQSYYIGFLFICLLFAACNTPIPESIQNATANLPDQVDFNYHIKPILSDRCYKCHGPDANQRQADYRLDVATAAFSNTNGENSQASKNLIAGNLQKSEIFHRLISDDPEYMMPPPEANLALNEEEKALIFKWIEQGAEYKPHWSFEVPQQEALPKVENNNWTEQDLDYLGAGQIFLGSNFAIN